MSSLRSIKRALISVSDKTGILDFAKALVAQDVEILSTGGTAKLLMENNVAVTDECVVIVVLWQGRRFQHCHYQRRRRRAMPLYHPQREK